MIITINDLRKRARRRLPRALFDYIDGGAEDEFTLRENHRAFDRYTFNPRMLVDVSERNQSTQVLGETLPSPLIIAPTGFTGMFWPDGEIAGARAAALKRTIFTISTMSICSIEQIAAGAPGARLWFQIYVWRDRGLTRSLIDRAHAAGCAALVVTVDTPVLGHRERDIRNGLVLPPRLTAGNILDALRRPSWMWGILRHPKLTFGNFADVPGVGKNPVSLARITTSQFSPSVTWADLEWFRQVWSGPLIIKGILSTDDARRAVEGGADAIVVSNHGGRQCDFMPATLDVLPEIVDAVAGRADVILDGGIQRGSDVVKAVALGAQACMIGKAYNYGIAAAGEAGARTAIEILEGEIDRCLALIGRVRLDQLDRSALRARGSHAGQAPLLTLR